jgi:hypothetical protein
MNYLKRQGQDSSVNGWHNWKWAAALGWSRKGKTRQGKKNTLDAGNWLQ